MSRDELLKPDLLSEILLVASGVAVLVTLVLVGAAAFTSAVMQ